MAPRALIDELLNATVSGRLATLNEDGSVHLVAIWFLWDGEVVSMPTGGDRRKVRNLERDPRATLLVDLDGGVFDICGVMLLGRVEILRGPDALELNRRIHLKYVTERDLALEPIGGALESDDTTIRLRPERIRSWDYRDIDRERLALLERESRPASSS